MSIEVPASPKQKDALRAPSAKQAVPTTNSSLELAFAVISLCTLGAVAASADHVSILPPSLGQWLEIGAALGLSCSANGVLALLVRRHGSIVVLGLCGLLLALPFAVPYTYPISASAHALVAFIGAWKAADMLAGTRPQAAVASGNLAYFAHMLSTVEFRTENAGTLLVAAAPGQWRRQLADVAARYAGLAVAASLRRAFAAIGATSLELYSEVWCIYTFLSLFTSTFSTALAAAGFQPQTVFNSPLLRTTSVSDFWGRRWNLLIHGLFRRSVFQPLRRRGCPAWAAGALAFAISGMFHEYAFAPGQPNHAASAGRCFAFFLAQAPVVSFDRWARGQPALAPPWPFRTSDLACTVLWTMVLVPLAPLFLHPLKQSGVFEELEALVPRLAL